MSEPSKEAIFGHIDFTSAAICDLLNAKDGMQPTVKVLIQNAITSATAPLEQRIKELEGELLKSRIRNAEEKI